MGRLRRSGFERALASLDGRQLAAFVADLWTASGRSATADGDVVAEQAGRPRRIRVVPAHRRFGPRLRRPDLDDPDVVVDGGGSRRVAAAARAADAEYVGPDELRERLLYGIDRSTAATLSERHLGRPLDPDGSAAESPDGLDPATLAGVLGLVVVVVVAAGPLGGLGGVTDRATPTGGRSPHPTATDATTPTPGERGYPPGLAVGGVVNVSDLARSHVAELEGHRYALTISFSGPAAATGFANWTRISLSLRVERSRHYRIDATYYSPDDRPFRLGVFSNGDVMYRRIASADGVRYVALPAGARSADVYLYSASEMLVRYLDTNESSVARVDTGHGTRYHVVATGKPNRLDLPVTDYLARAWVTPQGRVTRLVVTYTILVGDTRRTVTVELDYSEYRSALVDPPPWYDEARRQTDL